MLPETAPARTAPVTLLAVPRLPMLACLLTTTMITVHLPIITQLSSVIHYQRKQEVISLKDSKCFNPCCIGLGIQTALDRAALSIHELFQSLLYWIGYSNLPGGGALLDGQRGFNPCCIGLGIQTFLFGALDELDMRFQSLLYWIGYSNSLRAINRETELAGFNPCCIGLGIQTVRMQKRVMKLKAVSILVVLDWVFKPIHSAKPSLQMASFNPCCIGLGIQTLHCRGVSIPYAVSILVVLDWVFKRASLDLIAYADYIVSILVVLDWVFKQAMELVKLFRDQGFQSLLYWIGYSNSMSNRSFSLEIKSFNPCCIGLGIQTAADDPYRLRYGWFQSLLYWIGYSNAGLALPVVRSLSGFNPCCIGLGIQTKNLLKKC